MSAATFVSGARPHALLAVRPRIGSLWLIALLLFALVGSAAPVAAATGTTGVRGSLRNTATIQHRDGAAATLRQIRVGRHTGFDRVVFQFAGGLPAYTVRYVPVARSGGSGAPIPVLGTVALQIDLQARSVNMDDPAFPKTFTPGGPLTPGFATLRQVRWGGEFEGVTTLAAGLRGRSGFRVLELSGPTRLAIDVAHGARVRSLSTGARGVDVRDWQVQLNTVQFGQFASSQRPGPQPLATDGIFGPRTLHATRTFQRAEGVDAIGIVGPRTRAAMERALQRAAQIRP